jgi:Gti1/Pac2 family transcription factor
MARSSGGNSASNGSRQDLNDPPTPSYEGYLHDEWDLAIFLEAVFRGHLHHAKRRLHKDERGVIQSGQVWVCTEKASGIKRWTDTLDWSPSRQLGAFLIYREVVKSEEKKKLLSDERRMSQKRKFSDLQDGNDMATANSTSSAGKTNPKAAVVRNVKGEERKLEDYFGALIDQYDYVEDGLVKKAITIDLGTDQHHVICYYKLEDVINDRLKRPSQDPSLLGIHPPLKPRPGLKEHPRIASGLRTRPLPMNHALADEQQFWYSTSVFPQQYVAGSSPWPGQYHPNVFTGAAPGQTNYGIIPPVSQHFYAPAPSAAHAAADDQISPLDTHVPPTPAAAQPSTNPISNQIPAYTSLAQGYAQTLPEASQSVQPATSSVPFSYPVSTAQGPSYAVPPSHFVGSNPVEQRSTDYRHESYFTPTAGPDEHRYHNPEEQYDGVAAMTAGTHGHENSGSNQKFEGVGNGSIPVAARFPGQISDSGPSQHGNEQHTGELVPADNGFGGPWNAAVGNFHYTFDQQHTTQGYHYPG